MTYGLPGGRDADFRGQKVAQYNGGPAIASARAQDGRIRKENRQLMTDYAERSLPGLIAEPFAETTCLFTNTPRHREVDRAFEGSQDAEPRVVQAVVTSATSGWRRGGRPLAHARAQSSVAKGKV